jgi:hypothetical protein
MSSDVEITIAEAVDVVAVPVAALAGRDGSYTVRVLAADGSVEPRAVSVGLVSDTLAEIRARYGLSVDVTSITSLTERFGLRPAG